MTEAPARPAVVRKPPMSEAELQTNVIDAAHKLGWAVVHFRAARVIKNGKVTWRTPVQGDGAGFPDLLMIRTDRGGLVIELKSDKGNSTSKQLNWLSLFRSVPGFQAYVWRPTDWHSGAIIEMLR